MLTLKTKEEIGILREGGAILSRVLGEVAGYVKPGVTTGELDELAERLMREAGGEPSFKGYCTRKGGSAFPTAICASINHEIVHAPAISGRELRDGDIIGLDMGLKYKGYYTDTAITVGVGKISREAKKLLRVTREALLRAISEVKPGNHISDIGRAIQKHVEGYGFSVVRDLVGHGVGRQVHEDPQVPNYFDPHLKPVELVPGMAIAIEPMVNEGAPEVETLEDGWTIVTADGTLAAHFEATVAVTEKGNEILTPLP